MPYKDLAAKKANSAIWYKKHKAEHAARCKAYRESHKEEIAAKKKTYQESHREELAAKKKAYRDAHKEELAAKKKAYQDAHKDYLKEYFAKHYESNRDKVIASSQSYYATHTEECIARQKEYYQNNKSKISARSKLYREEHRDILLQKHRAYYHESSKKEAICLYCGKLTKVREKFCSLVCAQKWHCGPNSSRWRGGISYEPYCPKFNNDLKVRIRAFFDYRCVLCGKHTRDNAHGRQLSCHHVEYNKQACCDGKPVHFAALCQRCHVNTNCDRERWESMIHRVIYEIYNGRSYFTKDEWVNLQHD